MIFADKIIALRKKCGWSQEELAERMCVTRQSVSKWEGAQSVPDLERILLLGRLFGVSTDYLLKDEMEEVEYTNGSEDGPSLLRVTLSEASAFLAVKEVTAKRISFAVFLCVISPVCLLLMSAAQEAGALPVGENLAAGVGMIALLLLAAAAMAIFVSSGAKTAPYGYLEKEPFETEYGVAGMVKERQDQFRNAYARNNVLGACICVLSAIPMFACLFVAENDLICVVGLCATMIIAGIGVVFFILGGIPWASMQKLLQVGDYTKPRKQTASRTAAISTIYWLLVVAGFLAYSFITEDWRKGWIVWPVAGVLYAAVIIACGSFRNKE